MSRVQVKELAPGMGQATDFGDALRHELFVATEVITHKATTPIAQEGFGVLPGA